MGVMTDIDAIKIVEATVEGLGFADAGCRVEIFKELKRLYPDTAWEKLFEEYEKSVWGVGAL